MTKRMIIGVSGASGARLAQRLLETLREFRGWESHLVCSEAARRTIEHETPLTFEAFTALADVAHDNGDIGAGIASGSFAAHGMIIIPCSMKSLAAVAHGYADNLLLRAADVTLKERRTLLLLPRETPLHAGHLKNMAEAASLGAIIMPPVMTYYMRPQSIADMEDHLVAKALGLFGLDVPGFSRWEGLPGQAPESAADRGGR